MIIHICKERLIIVFLYIFGKPLSLTLLEIKVVPTLVIYNEIAVPLGVGWVRPKKDISWPFHGFQPQRHIVFAVSLKLLISKGFLSIPSPIPIGIKHAIFLLAREGMLQGTIAAIFGVAENCQSGTR